MNSNHDSSFVRDYLRLQSRMNVFDTGEQEVAAPPESSQAQLRLGVVPVQLGDVFPSVAHHDFSVLLAGASDDDLLALGESGYFLPEMYPRSNGTRAQKLLPLLKTLCGVQLDKLDSLNLSAAA